MIDCMRGDHPPLCGGCDNRLRTPPALWALIEIVGAKTAVLCAICRACAGRDPTALGRAVLGDKDAVRVPLEHIHRWWGRA